MGRYGAQVAENISMTGSELAIIRKALGLTTTELGRAIGYTGTDDSVASSVRRLESKHDEPIPDAAAKLSYIFECLYKGGKTKQLKIFMRCRP